MPAVVVPVSVSMPSMGGSLAIHLDVEGANGADPGAHARHVMSAIERWAARLTRHSTDSDLARLNADARAQVAVHPTLAAALRAGRLAGEYGEGLVDITMLDARLAAEAGAESAAPGRAAEWSMRPECHGSAMVARPAGLHFDLGGVGKGWIADRAAALLDWWPGSIVDADGDLAVVCAPGRCWEIGVADPRDAGADLATLRLSAAAGGPRTRWGVATSGVSVHRWTSGGLTRHHLIDPRTGRPAVTDVVQATVVAGSALRAESLAKAALIAGTGAGFALLERARVPGAILLTSAGEVLALPQTLQILANEPR